MEKDLDFLNYMYKNAKMGIVGIDDVIKKAKAKDLKDVLYKQKLEYEAICKEIEKVLEKKEAKTEEINIMAKVASSFMSSIKLAEDSTDSMIAKMMIEGTNKGIIEINEKLNNIPNIDRSTKKIALKLLKIEQLNLSELKKYL